MPCQPKVGHVSFLGPLDHTQMRAGAWSCPSQLSGSERDSQTPERACSTLELLMHASAGPSRSVPGYACPFAERTEHIQKRARLQSPPERLRFHANTGLAGTRRVLQTFFWL
jgi:hypothetical protein